jgi:NMD protein affecting ribosome stability and mRNA decay
MGDVSVGHVGPETDVEINTLCEQCSFESTIDTTLVVGKIDLNHCPECGSFDTLTFWEQEEAEKFYELVDDG